MSKRTLTECLPTMAGKLTARIFMISDDLWKSVPYSLKGDDVWKD
jgi:hypothetical protein